MKTKRYNDPPETEHTIYRALEDNLRDKEKIIENLIDKIIELEETIAALEKTIEEVKSNA
jgi:septal ring factor EnvC (AmiA/AmiB activator)